MHPNALDLFASQYQFASEVASMQSVIETTVKTHLQHIFAKTGTTRQVDLVKLG
jgi:DNA-binding CsgD family transcriptional regulator